MLAHLVGRRRQAEKRFGIGFSDLTLLKFEPVQDIFGGSRKAFLRADPSPFPSGSRDRKQNHHYRSEPLQALCGVSAMLAITEAAPQTVP